MHILFKSSVIDSIIMLLQEEVIAACFFEI